MADRGYDSNEIIDKALQSGCQPVIPPKKSRKVPREYDKDLYRVRHLVENAFLHLKRWRGIATRYAKRSLSFLVAVQIRCISLWTEIIWRQYLEKSVDLQSQEIPCQGYNIVLPLPDSNVSCVAAHFLDSFLSY